jgi:hypothetical protein
MALFDQRGIASIVADAHTATPQWGCCRQREHLGGGCPPVVRSRRLVHGGETTAADLPSTVGMRCQKPRVQAPGEDKNEPCHRGLGSHTTAPKSRIRL